MIELSSPKELRKFLKSKAYRNYIKNTIPAKRSSKKLILVRDYLEAKYGRPIDTSTVDLSAMYILMSKIAVIFSDFHEEQIGKLLSVKLAAEYGFEKPESLAKEASKYLQATEDGFYADVYHKDEPNKHLASIRFYYYGDRLEIEGFEDECETPIENPAEFFKTHPFCV